MIKKILFGLLNNAHTEPEAYDNRMQMMLRLGMLDTASKNKIKVENIEYPEDIEYDFSIATIGDTFPALARERMAEVAVDDGFDYLFMVDDDMLCMPNLFERLVRHNVDIVAPLAFTRRHPISPVVYALNKGYDPLTRQKYFINNIVHNYPKDTLFECDAVGFGAVLIKTSVFKGMKKNWFMSTSPAGEDIQFCHLAGEQGFKIFCDSSTKIIHLGAREQIDEVVYEKEQKNKEYREVMGEFKK